MIDVTSCPECGELAEVQERDVLASTGDPVEHVKILCVNRHWFLMPAETLSQDRSRDMASPAGRGPLEPAHSARPAPERTEPEGTRLGQAP